MKKKARFLSFILAFVMLVPLFSAYGFALEEDSEASSSDSATTENASVTWEDVIAGMATPDEYYEANGTSDLSAELGSEASAMNTTVENGTYCLNNKSTGKYMYYNTSTVTSKNGYVSSLGSYSRWGVYETENGYVIYSSYYMTKYLSVSSTSSTGVELLKVSDSEEIPETCYWDFSVASGGGMLIQSLYNSYYLCSNDTSLSLASSTGTAGTDTYYQKVWRVATKSNIEGKELTSFSVSRCTMYAGNSKAPHYIIIFSK